MAHAHLQVVLKEHLTPTPTPIEHILSYLKEWEVYTMTRRGAFNPADVAPQVAKPSIGEYFVQVPWATYTM